MAMATKRTWVALGRLEDGVLYFPAINPGYGGPATRLPAVFSENVKNTEVVFQREVPIPVWPAGLPFILFF